MSSGHIAALPRGNLMSRNEAVNEAGFVTRTGAVIMGN